jgi:HD superfamily phosphodiesterase
LHERVAVIELNIPLILYAVLEDYAVPWGGYHGVAHWARVFENGLRLAEETGAKVEVVELFAVLHDSRRVTIESGKGAQSAVADVHMSRLGCFSQSVDAPPGAWLG